MLSSQSAPTISEREELETARAEIKFLRSSHERERMLAHDGLTAAKKEINRLVHQLRHSEGLAQATAIAQAETEARKQAALLCQLNTETQSKELLRHELDQGDGLGRAR